MADLLQPGVIITPGDAIKRRTASWTGIAAEIVQFAGAGPFEYEYCAPVHLFIACQRASRSDGETSIEGLRPSRLRDFSQKLLFVPANHRFKGRFVPRVLPLTTYIYIDPARIAADPGLEFGAIDFAPRLFFEDPRLWSTAEKLIALTEFSGLGSRLYGDALGAILAVELAQLERGRPMPAPSARGGLAAWQARAAREYVEANLAQDISLADLRTRSHAGGWTGVPSRINWYGIPSAFTLGATIT